MTGDKLLLVNIVLGLIGVFSCLLFFFYVFAFPNYQQIENNIQDTGRARTQREQYFTQVMGEFGIQVSLLDNLDLSLSSDVSALQLEEEFRRRSTVRIKV